MDTSHTSTADSATEATAAEPYFAHPEGLRQLLYRMAESDHGGWDTDPDADVLLRYATDRYAELARKHHCEPQDAAVAVFEAMTAMSTRVAAHPWGVVTLAVERTLIAEERANDLLTSTEQARRPEVSQFHDVTRFGDHDYDPTEVHPALQVPGADAYLDEDGHRDGTHTAEGADRVHDGGRRQTAGASAVGDTIHLLTMVGWPTDVARMAVSYVCSQLMDIGDRETTYERLRRDKAARAQFDLPHASWIGLLRLVVGHPHAPTQAARVGVVARLLSGETIADLLADDSLVLAVDTANPHTLGADRGESS